MLNQKAYTHYVVVSQRGTPKIESGWESAEDAADNIRENFSTEIKAKVLTKTGLIRAGLDPKDDGNWLQGGHPLAHPARWPRTGARGASWRVIQIVSGEGVGEGVIETYSGARTLRALRTRLTKERRGGDRWAFVKVDGERVDDLDTIGLPK
jgi:hypothetical protein